MTVAGRGLGRTRPPRNEASGAAAAMDDVSAGVVATEDEASAEACGHGQAKMAKDRVQGRVLRRPGSLPRVQPWRPRS